ncbi:MAG: Lacal_2735 family protein [Polaribacter sp.]|nr:Lacal_2735 family protein [Polaribacter sp.]
MFGLFKKKSEVEKLHEEYKKIMQEAYKLQSINRSESDQKYLEADTILNKIKLLEEKK